MSHLDIIGEHEFSVQFVCFCSACSCCYRGNVKIKLEPRIETKQKKEKRKKKKYQNQSVYSFNAVLFMSAIRKWNM